MSTSQDPAIPDPDPLPASPLPPPPPALNKNVCGLAGPPTPPPLPSPPPPAPRLPAWLWAPCALYAVSACCILIGLSKILVPLYKNIDVDKQVAEKFYCLATLNLYEIAILSVALLILLWRRVYDDAIALTLLIAIFLIASAIALDIVAPGFPIPVLLFGASGLLAATAKLYSLNRFIVGRIDRVMLAGIFALLVVNFAMPGLLALAANADRADSTFLILPWRFGWHATLIAGLILVASALRLRSGAAGARDIGKPFLRTTAMHWIVAGIILLGTVTHQHALTWAFNIPITYVELAPAAGLAALIVLELLRAYGYRLAAVDAVVCLAPLAVTAALVLLVREPTQRAVTLGFVSDPLFFLALFALAVSFNAWRREQTELHYLAAVYIVAAMLFGSVDLSQPANLKFTGLNWNLAGFTLGVTFAAIAAMQRNMHVAMISVITLAVSAATSPWAAMLVTTYNSSRFAMTAVAFGALTQVVYCFFRRDLPHRIALLGAIALAAGVLHLFFGTTVFPEIKGAPPIREALHCPIAAGILTAAYIGAVSIWTRNWQILIPGCIPITVAALTAKEGQGWVWIGMSFLALALGAAASIKKSWREEAAVEAG